MSAEVVQISEWRKASVLPVGDASESVTLTTADLPVLYDGAPWPDVPWPGGIDDLEWD